MAHKPAKESGYRVYLKKLVSIDDTPRRLALSFSIGVFISISPFYGLHSAAAVAVSTLFKLNMPALLIGSWMNNPLTTPFVYWACYYIGRIFLGGTPIAWNMPWHKIIVSQAGPIFLNILIGWVIMGAVSSVLSYWVMKAWIERRRMRSMERDEHEKR